MTKLATLNSHIRSLRNRRATARSATAWSAVLLAVLWSLLVFFAVDWALSLTVLQRVILIAVAVGVVAWVFRSKALPWLTVKETDLDVALLVEKKQKIDSDLVAAIQFESPQAADWGSHQLEDAVVDYVAEFSRGWNVFDGFTREKFAKRAMAVAATGILIALLYFAVPGHFRAFLNRLALGAQHYPSDTQIEYATISGAEFKTEPDGDPNGGNYPYGQPLKFRVMCSGDLPESGLIKLDAANGLATEIEVERVEESAGVPAPEGKAFYEGELPRLVDTLECQMFFGDAYTDPRTLFVLPLPVIEATLVGTPPSYARGSKRGDVKRSTAKQFKTLEGSRVDIEVVCKNKNLKEVTLVIDRPTEFDSTVSYERDSENRPIFKLTASEGDEDDDDQQIWRLSGKNTPLDMVRGGGVAYHLDIVDEHGMRPDRAISGSIVAEPDMPPTAKLAIVTNYWLPEAKPELSYRISDHYGVKQAVLDLEILRGETGETEKRSVSMPKISGPIPATKLPAEDVTPLDLKQFGLAKGDEVTIQLRVSDDRGENEGVIGTSDSLKLIITDADHIRALALDPDKHSVEQLDRIEDAVRPDRP